MQAEAETVAVIDRHIAAVSSVRQVVHALWALAHAELPRVEAAAADATSYLDWVDTLVNRLVGTPRELDRIATLHVVMGPERSFSGPLAYRIARQLPPAGKLGLVGTRLCEIAKRDERVRARVAFEIPAATSYDEHERVAREVADRVLRETSGAAVRLHHPVTTRSDLASTWVLAGARDRARLPPDTYSALPLVIERALFESTSSRLAVALAETLKCEVLARIASTDQARLACDRRLEELAQQLRTVHKEQITDEILEVVAGSAVSGGSPLASDQSR